jgi:glutathione peroxidase
LQVLLLVNVASQCSQTDTHYKALKRLHDILSYSERFSVLAFPCNDFGEQEPWEPKEIEEFVRGHFKAEFPLFSKTSIVAGPKQHPLWKFVIREQNPFFYRF